MITLWTTIRLLYAPKTLTNVVSQRIVKGKPPLPSGLIGWGIGTGVLLALPLIVVGLVLMVLLKALFFLIPVALWLFSSPITGALAAAMTVRESESGLLQEVAVTPLRDHEILVGLVAGIMLRMKGWRNVVIYAFPVLAFLLIADYLASGVLLLSAGLRTLLVGVALTANLVGTNLLSAVVGVGMALRLPRMTAVALTVGVMLVYLIGGMVALGFVAWSIFRLYISLPVGSMERVMAWVIVLCTVIPYALAALILNMSSRLLRSDMQVCGLA